MPIDVYDSHVRRDDMRKKANTYIARQPLAHDISPLGRRDTRMASCSWRIEAEGLINDRIDVFEFADSRNVNLVTGSKRSADLLEQLLHHSRVCAQVVDCPGKYSRCCFATRNNHEVGIGHEVGRCQLAFLFGLD